ncbi:glycoside hydrolase family 127 protein [Xanthomonas cucurbitae]|nr:beta-L-arabinofuranosidase domain-containing protein [Xanthomonas cucurbitae]WDM79144.1 glycoside hydrolase family 127 protein [Xanthomonas cucurbitae]WDM82828.1 glycoside hydrolase family 127 protein [Xanthomonas cucurbitae]
MTHSNDIDLTQVALTAPFWRNYQALVREVALPYQWEALNDRVADAEPSHAIANFRIAAGRAQGQFHGMIFQDSDVAKWLEAVAYVLCQQPDPALEAAADAVIELVAAAQQPDGYLNTYFSLVAPAERWTNLAECHELYCAGHLFEAGVAYVRATGKRALLEVCCRFADHIDATFGTAPGQLQGYPGHPEIELALLRLYEVTDNARYLALARYFVDQRGTQPHWYDQEYERRGRTAYWDNHGSAWMVRDKGYSQAHLPVVQQQHATGHAVRFVYLMTAVAHLALLEGDADKRQACLRLWEDMVQRQLYVTGAIGAQSWGESFTSAYDLPNDTAYAESCASVGLMLFAKRMLQMEGDARFADVMERALYNTVLAGISLDGKAFFYVNPLETVPRTMAASHAHDHVKPVRQPWFGCACCPPNIARLLASLGQYLYTQREDALSLDMYAGGQVELVRDGVHITLSQRTDYPWDGRVEIGIAAERAFTTTLALRIPDWCPAPTLALDDVPLAFELRKGYAVITRQWQPGQRLVLELPMPIRRVSGHALLRQAAGKLALQRGPLVYCLEQVDNGSELYQVALPRSAEFTLVPGEGALAGMTLIQTDGLRRVDQSETDTLYRYDAAAPGWQTQRLCFVPYFAWGNRGEGEMRVWVESAEA